MGDSVIDRDPLAELGIVPVNPAFMSDYKQDYQDAFRRRKIEEDTWHHYWRYEWRSVSYHDWRKTKGYITTLEQFLAYGIPGMMGGAPWELVELAKLVERRIPDAEFRVEFFGYDPILRVFYLAPPPYPRRAYDACLGIWEGASIKAMAIHNP